MKEELEGLGPSSIIAASRVPIRTYALTQKLRVALIDVSITIVEYVESSCC